MSPRSLAELRRLYVREARPLPRAVEAELREDPRSGARAILEAVETRRREQRREGQRRRRMLRHERALQAEGLKLVAGVDEAGMSPWAGPIVAAAVILPRRFAVPGIDDSKRLSPDTRAVLAAEIRSRAHWAVGSASPAEIRRYNLHHAGLLAMRRAVVALRPSPQALIVDARRVPGFDGRQVDLIEGDRKSYSVAAASILAKTVRDAFMTQLDALYPGYDFSRHKGYGVPSHRDALRRKGPCPAHRCSFAAVRACIADLQNESESAECP